MLFGADGEDKYDNLLYQQSLWQKCVEMEVLMAVSVMHVNGLMKLF